MPMKEKRKLLWVDRDTELYSGNYIGMFDLTKGIIMLGVILLHCCNDYLDVLTFASGETLAVRLLLSPLAIGRYGAVPMLFMICGYGIRRQPPVKSIKNQLKLFAIPYCCVILVVAGCELAKWCIAGGSLPLRLFRRGLPFLLGLHPGEHSMRGSLEQIGPVWFFFTYTFASIYLNWVLQEKQVWVQALILAAGTAAALILTGIALPFCLQQIAICAGFMFVGMLLKRGKVLQQKLRVPALILVFLLCAFGTEVGGWAEIGNNVYVLGGVDLVIAYLAGIVLLWLHQRLDVLQGVLADGLRWTGRHMMWLCCVHTVTCVVVPWDKMATYFQECPAVGLLLEIGISFFWAFGACYLIEFGIKKLLVFRRKGK